MKKQGNIKKIKDSKSKNNNYLVHVGNATNLTRGKKYAGIESWGRLGIFDNVPD